MNNQRDKQQDDFDRVLRINANTGQLTPEELAKFREYLDFGLIFNRDYTWGYTQALLDIVDLFDFGLIPDIFSSLKLPKTLKTMHKFMKFLLENREVLRNRNLGEYYIGYNEKEGKFSCKTKKELKSGK